MFDIVVAAIPGLPLLAALANGLNGLVGERYPRAVQVRVASGAILLSFLGASWVLLQVVLQPAAREVVIGRWLTSGDLAVNFAFLIDPLSAVMMLVTTSISFLIAVFSIDYMHNERGFSRFFSVLPLFVAAMLVLVMGANYVLLFLGWEAVGVCSYLLISFYQDRAAAAQAGTKAFVMNRIGDAGFLLGIFLLFSNLGTTDYQSVFARVPDLETSTATAIGLCLLLGAVGKSAQLPLATWLPRAMEGPTPSSALIHAATMVTAGVYMISRSQVLYDHAPDALLVVALVGAATAVYGGVVGLVQTDIKSVLAYSTTTQLGLMFLACGLGAYAVAIFHLAAHAFFKTYLFLTAPSILHHLHGGADVHEAGPARQSVPGVFTLALVTASGLVSIAFLLWWRRRDLIDGAGGAGLSILLALGLIAAFSAAFAAARMAHVAFQGGTHGGHDHGPSPTVVAVQLLGLTAAIVAVGLAIGLVPGGVPGSWFQQLLAPAVATTPRIPPGSWVFGLLLLGLLIALIFSAWFTTLYVDRFRPEQPGLMFFRRRRLYNLVLNRFWLDELYDALIVRPVWKLGRALDSFDTKVIDWFTGAPPAPQKVRTAVETWEERLLASRAAGAAVGPRGEMAMPSSTWEEEERREKDATATEATGVFGWLTRTSALTARRVETEIGEATGVLGWMTSVGADASGWVETEVERHSPGGGGGRLVGTVAAVSTWFERTFIERASEFVTQLAELAAVVSAAVERIVFHSGIHVGMPRASSRLASALIRTEELLGRRGVIGSIVAAWLLALVARLLWF
ncbi:MAG: NADH-quinone oxidoreductase subunit L [Vicinamibacterales bacterium]